MKRFVTVPAFLLFIVNVALTQHRSVDMDALVGQTVRQSAVVKSGTGLAVAIFYNNQRVYYNYGYAGQKNNRPVSQNTLFEIGSVTKTFAGYLLAKAATEKKVNLDDDIRKYLKEDYPNLDYRGMPIRLQHLLNHSSGLPYDYIDRKPYEHVNPDSLPFILSKLEAAYTPEQLLKDLHTTTIDTVPGIQLKYSNAAAQLLGIILEGVYHRPYIHLLQQRVLKPAKMSTTGFYASVNKEKVASGYNQHDVKMPYNQSGAAGGLLSSSEELLSYAIFQLNEANMAVLLSHSPTWGQIEYFAMGLNWQMQKKKDYRRIWQSGSTAGFTSWLSIYPEKKICVVLLSNRYEEHSQDALAQIEENILSALLK